MRQELLNWIRCAKCNRSSFHIESFNVQEGETYSGIIICDSCKAWYPIVESIPIISINPVLVREEKAHIQRNFATEYDFSSLLSTEEESIPERERLQRHQIEHFTHETENYDRTVANTVFWQSVAANTAWRWGTNGKKYKAILEVGCGTGLATIPLLKTVNTVVAVDICFSAIKKAQDTIKSLKLDKQAYFVCSEAEQLPFLDKSFEAAIFTGMLHHVAEPAQVVKEMGRILTEGGSLFGCENNYSIFRPIFDFLMRLIPLWEEEAGVEPLIKSAEVKNWGNAGRVAIKTKTSVFLPPHLFNLVPLSFAKQLLFMTDRLFGLIPFLRNHGGLIIISGEKLAETAL
jgi:ubiquinone/menaquinone biosynthesis C-methylase UbiE/uncharacterized protein YbaR (Trm112 family)